MKSSQSVLMLGCAVIIGGLATVAGTLGFQQYQQGQKDTVSEAVPAVIPQAVPVQATSVQPLPSPQPVVQPVAFESLPICDQLDSVFKAGKNVAQFIADSGRYSEFAAHVNANCNWHQEQLKLADAILNPPVVVVQPKVIEVQPVPQPTKPTPAWNNCNGIQEPGESFSSSCTDAQHHNDHTTGWRDGRDNRDWNKGGWDNRGNTSDDLVPRDYVKGYSADGYTPEPEASQDNSAENQ